MPGAVHPRFHHRVEVHGSQARRVNGHQTRGNVFGAQQRNDQVCVVAADSPAGQERVRRAVGVAGRAGDVTDVPAHPLPDGRQQLTALQASEQTVRRRQQPVRLAVPARAHVADEVGVVLLRCGGCACYLGAIVQFKRCRFLQRERMEDSAMDVLDDCERHRFAVGRDFKDFVNR